MRKMAISLWDGSEYTFDLEPCLNFGEMTYEEQRSFRWARRYCHNLPYLPTVFEESGYECRDATMIAMSMIEDHGATICYYKGGVLEQDLLAGEIELLDLERHGVVKSPMNLSYHSPLL